VFASVQAHEDKPYKVVIQRNGPYQVFGNLPLFKEIIVSSRLAVSESWKRGEQVPTGDTYLICRCGQTKKSPFCDGTHIKIYFQGDEVAQHRDFFDDMEITKGPSLTLNDAVDLCIGARFCYKAGGVWKLTEQSADPEKKQMAIQEACNCPSGRLMEYENATNEETSGEKESPGSGPGTVGLAVGAAYFLRRNR
jgi:CDGSH-type Zn-finger protein